MSFNGTQVGQALVIGPAQGPRESTMWLATPLQDDPGRLLVVADQPDIGEAEEFWYALATLLQGKGPVRLVLSSSGAGLDASPAQWLADQLGTEVVAPDSIVVPTCEGRCLFVVPDSGPGGAAGRWVSFRPQAVPRPFGPRFPAPLWEEYLPPGRQFIGADGLMEPIPAGLWVHGQRAEPGLAVRQERPLLALPAVPDLLTVVLGAPGQEWLARQDVSELLTMVPWLTTVTSVRLVSYGHPRADALGQLLADGTDRRTVTTIGVPLGPGGDLSESVLHQPTGRPTWRPFATEATYWPRQHGSARDPLITRVRAPIAGLPAVRDQPALFAYGPETVLEVVQSGLWLRGSEQPPASSVRAVAVDPDRMRLTVGVPGRPTPDGLVAAAYGLAERLEPEEWPFVELSIQQAVGDPITVSVSAARGGRTAGGLVSGVPAGAGPSDTDRAEADLYPAAPWVPRHAPPAPAPAAPSPWSVPRPRRQPPPVPQAAAVPVSESLPAPGAPQREEPVRHSELPAPSASPYGRGPGAEQEAVLSARPALPAPTPPESEPPLPIPELEREPVPEREPLLRPQPVAEPVRPAADRPESDQAGQDPEPVESPAEPLEPAEPGPEPAALAVPGPPQPQPALSDVFDRWHRSTADERAWLHARLGPRFDVYASSVARLIAVHPGLRALGGVPGGSTIADLVAVKSYLGEGKSDVDEAIANGRFSDVLPYLGCVVSGLRQLPSYRGIALCGGGVDPSAEPSLLAGAVIGEKGLRRAVTAPEWVLPGSVEFVIWSTTGRRFEMLEPDRPGEPAAARGVIFLPGTRFRVLDAGTPEDAVRRVLLREVPESAVEAPLEQGDLAVLDRLAGVVAKRDGTAGEESAAGPGDDWLEWHLEAF